MCAVRQRPARQGALLRCLRLSSHPDGRPAAEYKQVTVLFADVVGSMKLAAVLQTRAAARDHERVVQSCGRGGAALSRHGRQVHR